MAAPEYAKTSTNKLGRLANRGLFPIPPFIHSPLSSNHPNLSSLSLHTNVHHTGSYDFPTIHGLINACPILHVSFNDPEQEFPVILPMLGCTGNFEDQDAEPGSAAQDLYVHGYVSGRLFKRGKDATGQGEGKGLPVSIAAT